jgi:predicted Zn-dependent protease
MAARQARLLLALLLLAAAACAGRDGRRFDLASIAEVSEDDERSLGAQVDAAIQAQIPVIDDPVVLGFVNELGQRIVATLEPQPFIYRFRVVPNSTLNAFALPAGYVYFHSATILQAGTLNELAGVMGHEIAHVKAHHYARGTEKAFWPSLLARTAGLAAAVATGQPGFAAAAEGANVALQLKYSREFETEADELGAVFMARAGFDPAGMGRFFERIVSADVPSAIHVPPYLYSHPDAEKRIAGVKQRAGTLRVGGRPDPELEASFRDAQARLALLVQHGRTSLQGSPPHDRSRSDPLLARANAAAAAGDRREALALLIHAERIEPGDPRLPFRRGELLGEDGRTREAIGAWRRAVALDGSVALAYYHLGNAYKSLGHRHDATYYYEQAARRFKPGGAFQQRALLALETLSYPPLSAAGFADGKIGEGAEAVAGAPRESFSPADAEVVWWGKLDKRYGPFRKLVRVRWSDPEGRPVQEGPAEALPKSHLAAHLALEGPLRERYGDWQVEAAIEGQVIDRRSFRLAPAP